MYHLIKQPEEQLRILFRNTAQKTGLHEAIVEKDFWVCLKAAQRYIVRADHLCRKAAE